MVHKKWRNYPRRGGAVYSPCMLLDLPLCPCLAGGCISRRNRYIDVRLLERVLEHGLIDSLPLSSTNTGLYAIMHPRGSGMHASNFNQRRKIYTRLSNVGRHPSSILHSAFCIRWFCFDWWKLLFPENIEMWLVLLGAVKVSNFYVTLSVFVCRRICEFRVLIFVYFFNKS